MTSHARDDALDEIAVAAATVASALAGAVRDKHPRDVDEADVARPKTAAEGIKAAGEAASAASYGPQGGNTDYRYRYEADYHYTTHQGEDRKRPAGFGAEQ